MFFPRPRLAAALLGILTTLIVLYLLNTSNKEVYINILEPGTYRNNDKNIKFEIFFDIKNFHYILNARKCENNTKINALIIVTSYFGNVETRSAMRRAFSEEDLKQINLKRVFLLGVAPSDQYTRQVSVQNENKRFGDIIQGNFIEAYRNLTYKHVMGLRWAAQNCFNVDFIIKMDDDTVVNVEQLPKLLKSLKTPKSQNFIAGYVLRNMLAIREPANKWYVTQDEYSLPMYPTFVSGWFYITNPNTAEKIYKLSQITKYFWIDDTFVTGILAQKLKVKHYDISKYYAEHSEYMECCLDDIRSKNLNCDVLVGPNGGNNNLFYEFNNAVGICNLHLCKNRTKPLKETCVAKKFVHLGRGKPQVHNYKLH